MTEELLEQKPEVISYDRLYKLWEQTNWKATDIDFSRDLEHWNDVFDAQQREAALWNYAMFLVGEEAVARTLSPVLDAAPDHAQKIFLTTQIVDEARHHVFFDRFMREVANKGTDTKSTLVSVDSYLTWGFRQVFSELDHVTDELRKKPHDRALLAQSLALYHVIIEGTLAVPGQHFIQRYLKKLDLLPGFSEGINNVSRDEARHVAFGIKFLGDLIRSSGECRAAAIEMWSRVLPWSAGVFIPPNFDRRYVECFDFTLIDIFAFGMRSFTTKLRRLGIEPSEIGLLAREDLEESYEERARRAWVLIESGVIGDDRREPELQPEAYEIIFEGMARALNLDIARTLDGPIEWNFTDADPWHIVVVDGHAEAKPGRAGRPAVKFTSSSSEWAKFAVGRTDPRRAILSRKLRVKTSPRNLARLPKLFG